MAPKKKTGKKVRIVGLDLESDKQKLRKVLNVTLRGEAVERLEALAAARGEALGTTARTLLEATLRQHVVIEGNGGDEGDA